MHQIDGPNAVNPAPAPGAVGTPGHFSEGNPGAGTPATIVSADWLNAVQGELVNFIEAAGLTLDKADNTQLLQAFAALAGAYPRGTLNGLEVTGNSGSPTTSIDIAPGSARDQDNALNMDLAAVLTKDITSVWTEGNGGGFPSGLTGGNVQPNTTYNVFVITKTTGETDGGVDILDDAANLLADTTGDGYVRYRKVGEVNSNSSNLVGNIRKLDQVTYGLSWQRTTANGPVVGLEAPVGWTVERVGIGGYRLTHNMNTSDYRVSGSVEDNDVSTNEIFQYWASKNANQIDLLLEDSGGSFQDEPVDIIIRVGRN